MEIKRVVITGVGAITPIGATVPEFWKALMDGDSGAGPITRFDPCKHKVKFACEVKNYDPANYFDRKESRRLDPFVQFAIIAAREALKDSGLDLEKVGHEEVGTIIGSGIGGLQSLEDQMKVLIDRGPERVAATLVPKMIANMAAGSVSISLGLKGPNNCTVTACASGSHAIGDAMSLVRRGLVTAMVAGGTEAAITSLGMAGFANAKALSTRNDSPLTASRPFSGSRDGFVMGEGSGVVVLEELEHAKARGAKIYGEIIGYGLTADAHHMTAPAPEGEGAQRAMRMAMRDAEVTFDQIDYINAHGTSTPLNDKIETIAIKKVFGDHANKLVISSIKGATGHMLGAAGGAEAIASLLAIKEGLIPGTINYTDPDPECDLDYITDGPRKADLKMVMSNSFGFGGHNASLLFKKYEE
jgi:3-oxoacyl-[acyl-carrier-protein] synthase II